MATGSTRVSTRQCEITALTAWRAGTIMAVMTLQKKKKQFLSSTVIILSLSGMSSMGCMEETCGWVVVRVSHVLAKRSNRLGLGVLPPDLFASLQMKSMECYAELEARSERH